MKKEKTDSLKKNRKIALFGVLCAEAVALSYLEGLLPSFIPFPTRSPFPKENDTQRLFL